MSARRFLTAQWRNLLMLNYAVDPAILVPLVPAGTVLDQHAGLTYLSLVAFQFRDTRLLGMRIPFHHTFEEVNLRFYVRRECPDNLRRAVVFIKELVPRRAIALVARALYNEPYHALPMRHMVRGEPPSVAYSWRLDGAWQTVAADARGTAAIPGAASHEAFITEHYWGYTRQRGGGTLEYRVEHPRWRVWPATLTCTPQRLEAIYGAPFAAALTSPASVLVAEGSQVTVYRGRRVED